MKDEHSPDETTRRRILQGAGAAGLLGLAGCLGGNGGGGGGSGNGSGNGGSGGSSNGGGGSSGNGSGGGSANGSESTSGGSSAQGGQLNLAQVKSPVEFDPIVLNDIPSAEVSQQIFEGLYAYGKSTGLVTNLAKKKAEVSKGGKRYVIELVNNAKFQNGDPVTATDVKYSFEAPVKEKTENASDVTMIDSIKPVDKKTVQFDLKYPYGGFSQVLAEPIVVPKSVREKDKKAFDKKKPVGSGPFKFAGWKEGNYANLERWDGYWGKPKPNISKIKMVPIEEATTRVTSLKNGKNDVIQEIPPKLYSTVKQQGNTNINEVPGIGYYYIALNCKAGPTTDPKVREAVDYCFDMDDAVNNFIVPTGLRQYSPLPKPIATEWDMPVDKWKKIPHGKDIDKAKKLFDNAGVDSNYSWKIIVPPDDKREQIGVSVSNGLQAAGFDASVQRLEWGTFLDTYNTGKESDYNIYALGWSGRPDPDAFTYYMFAGTDDVKGVTDGTFYSQSSKNGKKVSEDFVKARKTNDHKTRKKLYEDGITTLLEDRAHLPSYDLKNSFGVRDYVKDFEAHPVDTFHLVSENNNVSIQK